jgi:peptidyl-prolyl cis-trans isomerase C
MGPGLVARAGDAEITSESVERIARAQQLDAAAARDLAIRDALLANEARSRKLDADPTVAFSVQALLARHLLRALLDEAQRAGPVTEEELRETTARHWLSVDRPEGFRTVHALVQTKAKTPDTRKATELAEAVARDVATVQRFARETPPPAATIEPGRPAAADPVVARFREAATAAFDREKAKGGADDMELRVEPLPAITADGRVLAAEGGQFQAEFAAAAAKLRARGDVSGPTATPFGVHVIMLLERLPPQIKDAEERRKVLRDEIIADRARAAHTRVLERARSGVEIDRSADALLSLVSVEQSP